MIDACRLQTVQHREPGETGHADIEHDGADALAIEIGEKSLRAGPLFDAQTDGADQEFQRVAHRRIIVDQMNQRRERSGSVHGCFLSAFAVPVIAAGSSSENSAPGVAA